MEAKTAEMRKHTDLIKIQIKTKETNQRIQKHKLDEINRLIAGNKK